MKNNKAVFFVFAVAAAAMLLILILSIWFMKTEKPFLSEAEGELTHGQQEYERYARPITDGVLIGLEQTDIPPDGTLLYDFIPVPNDAAGIYYLTLYTSENAEYEKLIFNGNAAVYIGENADKRSAVLYFTFERSYYMAKLIFTELPIAVINIEGGMRSGDIPYNRDEESILSVLTVYSATDYQAANGGRGRVSKKARISIRGATSAAYPKKSYKISIIDNKGEKLNASFLGMRSDDDWVLNALFTDAAKIREKLSIELWKSISESRDYGEMNVCYEGEFLELIICGEYMGLYLLQEPIDAKLTGISRFEAKDDVSESKEAKYDEADIDKAIVSGKTSEIYKWSIQVPAVLYKCGSWEVPAFDKRIYGGFELKYPDEGKDKHGEEADIYWEPLRRYYMYIDGESENGALLEAGQVVDIANAVDFFIFQNLILGHDNCMKNVAYAAVNIGGYSRFFHIPWDFNYTWGNAWINDWSKWSMSRTYDTKAIIHLPITQKMSTDLSVDFKHRFELRWAELRLSGVLDAERLCEEALSLIKILNDSGAFARNSERWPEDFLYEDEAEFICSFINKRMDFLDKYANFGL